MSSESEETERGEGTPKKRNRWVRPLGFIVVVAAIIIFFRVSGLTEKLVKLEEFREWIENKGVWGPAIFVLVYIAGVVAAFPGMVLTIAAGVLFGSLVGIICVSIASTVGVSLAFLIARYFLRDTAARWLSKKEKFRKLDKLTEKHGAMIVAITRLIPVFPFNLQNYGYGLTQVRFLTYVFWSWLCMLPGTIVYVVGTDAFVKSISEGKVPWLLIILLATVIAILTLLIRHARRTLRSKEAEPDAENGRKEGGAEDE